MSRGCHHTAGEARGGKLRAVVEEAMVDFFHQVIPVSGLGLAEEAHGGIPRCVGAMKAPAPVGSVGEQCPNGFAKGTGQVGGGSVHGDYQVGLADDTGGVGKIADGIPQVVHV